LGLVCGGAVGEHGRIRGRRCPQRPL
jgi:hypothetical protein